ncbi:hypothetical protein SEA_REYNAULD_5 [Rhodococcus phage Reynauld]|uniref:Uncharacterized protein n=1 Tax=Rhodococcus phage Reynauld TaxID=3062845 RepID=A0ACD4UHB7_9CAUD|nr:hypothetical protein SEA_REYNAULD_5 [Rhodococcus phage Reynauld]
MKRCRTCGNEKPFGEFHRYRAGGTRLRGECKSCISAKAAARNAGIRDGSIVRKPAAEPEPTGESKTCSRCRIRQDTSQFDRDSRRADGRHSHCKHCRREQNTTYLIGGPSTWREESDRSGEAPRSLAAS